MYSILFSLSLFYIIGHVHQLQTLLHCAIVHYRIHCIFMSDHPNRSQGTAFIYNTKDHKRLLLVVVGAIYRVYFAA